jgi:hypothetical protein
LPLAQPVEVPIGRLSRVKVDIETEQAAHIDIETPE